ncbi:MAG: hypothetical protein C0401_11115 [Anaerolinea sp.]|nr:hypothetical protein [Anaerolinea sp.]
MRVVVGEVFDVAVDLRKSSPTFGQWAGTHLSAESKMQLWIPVGFAHGFYVLSEWAEIKFIKLQKAEMSFSARFSNP